MKKRIWVFSGRQGSGKTTYSKVLANRLTSLGYVPHLVKFADPLYKMHDACLPILKSYGVRPKSMKKDGELLQILGTEFGRVKLGENVWVDAAKNAVEDVLKYESTVAIIDDCRFENEYEAFHNDAHMVRLEAPEDVRKKRCSYWRDATDHPSETGLDEYDRLDKFHARVHTTEHIADENVEQLLKRWGYV